MRAREIVGALGGKWFGTYGMVKCVAHDDRKPSLKLCDGDNGRLLVYCHVGCESADILAELRRRGFLDGEAAGIDPAKEAERSRKRREEAERDRQRRMEWARRIWKETKPPQDTPVERYLRGRGITISIPPSLRFHPSLQYPDAEQTSPAMVAAVQSVERQVVAVHRTFLTNAGLKAFEQESKLSLGPIAGGAVRLAKGSPDKWLGICEGIETGLSVQQAAGIPVWAALSTSGIKSLQLPTDINMVVICADSDENGAGELAARAAAQRWVSEGRRVRIAIPPRGGKSKMDWNDVLNVNASTFIEESVNVA